MAVGTQTIGYIRDRTAAFKAKRETAHPGHKHLHAVDRLGNAFEAAETDKMALLESGPSTVGADDESLPSWMRAEREIRMDLTMIGALLKDLDLAQARAREDLFSADKSKSATADGKRREIKLQLKKTVAKLGALESLSGPSDHAVVDRVRRALGQQLTTLTKAFQQTELKEVRQRTERGASGSSSSGMESLLTQLAEPTPAFTEHQMQALETASQEYEKRDEEIASIVKVIHELSQIMRDLNTLVCEQGTMVDRIDQNIEAAAQQVERGFDEIQKAHTASKKSSMITIILCLSITTVIAFVLLIVMKF